MRLYITHSTRYVSSCTCIRFVYYFQQFLFLPLSFCDLGIYLPTVATTCTHGNIRLAGGLGPTEGRVEMCVQGRWTGVCHSSWNNQDAFVVCRQLGYPATGWWITKGHCWLSTFTLISFWAVQCYHIMYVVPYHLRKMMSVVHACLCKIC